MIALSRLMCPDCVGAIVSPLQVSAGKWAGILGEGLDRSGGSVPSPSSPPGEL